MSCSSAVSFLHFFFTCCTERCISSLSACTSASCRTHNHTHALLVIPPIIILLIYVDDLVLFKVSCLPLKMPFALLLSLQLVLKLLLEFLFGEVHFPNGSVVFYPPLASWRKRHKPHRRSMRQLSASFGYYTGIIQKAQ